MQNLKPGQVVVTFSRRSFPSLHRIQSLRLIHPACCLLRLATESHHYARIQQAGVCP